MQPRSVQGYAQLGDERMHGHSCDGRTILYRYVDSSNRHHGVGSELRNDPDCVQLDRCPGIQDGVGHDDNQTSMDRSHKDNPYN